MGIVRVHPLVKLFTASYNDHYDGPEWSADYEVASVVEYRCCEYLLPRFSVPPVPAGSPDDQPP